MPGKDLIPYLNWLGYTRRERRASALLIIIVFIVTAGGKLIPEKEPFMHYEILADTSFQASGDNFPTSHKTSGTAQEKIRKKEVKQIELNTADSALLVTLPGIGPVLAGRIIKYRALLGGFCKIIQLTEVYGISTEEFISIRGMVYADSTKIKMIEINNADFRTLLRHPYLEMEDVQAIAKYRELHGKIGSVSEMISQKVLTPEKANRVLPYLQFTAQSPAGR